MATPPLTSQQITELVGTRHATTGVEYPPFGLQPYYDWLIRSLHALAESSAGALRVSRDESNTTSIYVAPGRASIGGVALDFAGGVIDLAALNNDTALVWLADNAGAAQIDHADDATSWPGAAHVKLAEITLVAGEITHILDRRFETVLKA